MDFRCLPAKSGSIFQTRKSHHRSPTEKGSNVRKWTSFVRNLGRDFQQGALTFGKQTKRTDKKNTLVFAFPASNRAGQWQCVVTRAGPPPGTKCLVFLEIQFGEGFFFAGWSEKGKMILPRKREESFEMKSPSICQRVAQGVLSFSGRRGKIRESSPPVDNMFIFIILS